MLMIGDYVQQTRLAQNKTQEQVSTAAGINRTTLVQLEKGSGGTMATLIQVLRALQQLHIFNEFEYVKKASPLELAKQEQTKRKRARNTSPETGDSPDQTW